MANSENACVEELHELVLVGDLKNPREEACVEDDGFYLGLVFVREHDIGANLAFRESYDLRGVDEDVHAEGVEALFVEVDISKRHEVHDDLQVATQVKAHYKLNG